MQLDQRLTAAEQRERRQIRITEAMRERDRSLQRLAGAGRVAAPHRQQRDQHQRVTLLRAIAALFQQPLGPGEPSGTLRGIAAQ